MGSIMVRSIRVAATALVWLILPLVELVMAQPSATAPAPPAASDRNSPAYSSGGRKNPLETPSTRVRFALRSAPNADRSPEVKKGQPCKPFCTVA
jgi:hypothetical protein